MQRPSWGAVVLSALTTHHKTELAAIGNYGPANITANIFSECECSRRINRSASNARLIRRERSEEHTSELQSQSNLVCRLLLEKKKKKKTHTPRTSHNQPAA